MNLKSSQKGRLIVLPEIPSNNAGYRIAVKSDVNRLQPSSKDKIITYSLLEKRRIKGVPATNIKRAKSGMFEKDPWKNLLSFRDVHSLRTDKLRIALGDFSPDDFSSIFCGDVILYDAIRDLFPDTPLSVRFHNVFTITKERQKKLRYSVGAKFWIVLYTRARLESRIFRDTNALPIFITPDESEYFRRVYPKHRKYEIWEIDPINNKVDHPIPLTKPNKIVWFGSMAAHMRFCVEYFINKVFPELREQNEQLEFHLYGVGTKPYHAPDKGIHAFGYYNGEGLPDVEGLYINPDLLGGGIKLKIRDLIKNGAPFITTPFGASGYDLAKVENAYVADIDKWAEVLSRIFRKDLVHETGIIGKRSKVQEVISTPYALSS